MSGRCWDVLGLEDSSDERAIKRRYAQLLKVTRPDDDPAAFQRLRTAYEAALETVRAMVPTPERDVQDDLPAPPVEATAEPLLRLADADTAWLNQAFADLHVEHLDAVLAGARVRNCQREFELRLLQACLHNTVEAAAISDWALLHLQWLTPAQRYPLPPQHVNHFVSHLLGRRICMFQQQLAEGDQHAALDGLRILLDSPWLQSFDRREWAVRHVLDWLADDERRTPELVALLEKNLPWHANDVYGNRTDPALVKLSHYREGLLLLERLRGYLALRRPRSQEEKLTWMLFKDLSPAQGRRLADRFEDEDWLACGAMATQLQEQHPSLPPQLRVQGASHWRQWLARAEGERLNLILMVLLGGGTLVALLRNAGYGTVNYGSTVISAMGAGVGGILLVRACGLGLERLSHLLAAPDAWLSTHLLPGDLSKKGAGFLLIRHGLPCALIGVATGALAVYMGWNPWPVGLAASALAMVYAVLNLRRGWQPQMAGLLNPRALTAEWKRRIGWGVLIGAMVVGLSSGLATYLKPMVQAAKGDPCAHLVGQEFMNCGLRRIEKGQ